MTRKLLLPCGLSAVGVVLVAALAVRCGLYWDQSSLPGEESALYLATASFSAQPSALPAASSSAVILLSTGDVMLGRSVNYLGWKNHDFAWSWREVAPELEHFDYVIANLETPITVDCPLTNEGMLFCADASAAAALTTGPFDFFTLANNHIYNHGRDGYRQTRQLLGAAGLHFAGEGELATFSVHGENFGLLAYDDVTSPVDDDQYIADIQAAAQQVDHLLVALHFGLEYRYQPVPRQVELAHWAIDNGAEIVLGNHSHWLGPLEIYQDKPILYSHGNFIFDQMWSDETRFGLAAAWNYLDGRLLSVDLYPVEITHYGLAHWVAGTPTGERILQTFLTETGFAELSDDHVTVKLHH